MKTEERNMRRFTPRIIIALITFIIGVIAATAWMIHHHSTLRMEEVSSPCISGLGGDTATRRSDPDHYFPSGTFYADAKRNRFIVRWYSKHLAAMNEPSFKSLVSCQGESYRFLWLRSFHSPIAVRVWRSGNKRFLVSKELNGKGGYDPGNIQIEKTRPLSEDEWNSFVQLLSQASFGALPTLDEADEMLKGQDGAQWILEGVRDGRYHVVDRWSPKSGDYREACLYLLKLSGLETDPIY